MLFIKLVDSVCSHHDRASHVPQINAPATGLIHGHMLFRDLWITINLLLGNVVACES